MARTVEAASLSAKIDRLQGHVAPDALRLPEREQDSGKFGQFETLCFYSVRQILPVTPAYTFHKLRSLRLPKHRADGCGTPQ
jgi:hypothetical protein|tara:strand:+ start:2921 stop:3166 length:246 start_codon:yes stop_codon:yes gene_type:complete